MKENKLVDEIIEKQNNLEKEYGWYTHCVMNDYNNFYMNCHTHCFDSSFNHLDIQIVLGMDPKQAHQIINNILKIIIGEQEFKGMPIVPIHTIKDGDIIYINTVDGECPILFKEDIDDGRKVLRALFSDENKILPGQEGCDARYDAQLHYNTSKGVEIKWQDC